ncbi:MAG: hypothetical protein A3F17_05845 [Gammaproteobacteria bacterium RIFCSPHIGHO2_12_FULL_41_15]|nr:MAG: hypothetical protein A3F17_05845 [Gammaproteobacteria bacterium RIFCSPHIGHO2_12_FULL_41_15]
MKKTMITIFTVGFIGIANFSTTTFAACKYMGSVYMTVVNNLSSGEALMNPRTVAQDHGASPIFPPNPIPSGQKALVTVCADSMDAKASAVVSFGKASTAGQPYVYLWLSSYQKAGNFPYGCKISYDNSNWATVCAISEAGNTVFCTCTVK